MRKSVLLLIVAVTLVTAVPTYAELQNVIVGGQLHIRGNWFDYGENFNTYAAVEHGVPVERPRYGQRQRVHREAWTSYLDVWGEDFRSDYLTGIDSRGAAVHVSLYQGYIEADGDVGTALKARIGRQRRSSSAAAGLGRNERRQNDSERRSSRGLSFDAVPPDLRDGSVQRRCVSWAKLAERSPRSRKTATPTCTPCTPAT